MNIVTQVEVTADSASELVDSIATIIDTTIAEDQNTEILNVVTNVLENVRDLILENENFTVDESVSLVCVCSVHSLSIIRHLWILLHFSHLLVDRTDLDSTFPSILLDRTDLDSTFSSILLDRTDLDSTFSSILLDGMELGSTFPSILQD